MIQPRNLTSGIYRGGRRPLDVFRRVTAGIKATPMAGFGNNLSESDRWHIVNYVLSIPIDGAFIDEHGHQYHGGERSHAHHDHDKSTKKPADKPADKPKTTQPKSAKDKK